MPVIGVQRADDVAEGQGIDLQRDGLASRPSEGVCRGTRTVALCSPREPTRGERIAPEAGRSMVLVTPAWLVVEKRALAGTGHLRMKP